MPLVLIFVLQQSLPGIGIVCEQFQQRFLVLMVHEFAASELNCFEIILEYIKKNIILFN